MSRAGRRASRGRLALILAGVRGALWPLPFLGIVVAIGLGVGLPMADRLIGSPGQEPLGLVFSGGPAAARGLLSAIATALISVTGLVFSLTVVALQLSSSQYSPRLLRTFVSDRVVQLTLAQLALTFVYSLTVLRSIRTKDEVPLEGPFVPGLSITVAYLLTLLSVVALVLFLGHLARALRVETMLREVHQEATAVIERVLGDSDPEDGDRHGHDDEIEADRSRSSPLPPTAAAVPVAATGSGFLAAVDEDDLVDAAEDADLVLLIVPRVGDSVVEGTPVAHAWSTAPGEQVDVDAARSVLERGLRLTYERQAAEDFANSLRTMTDIAVRALSPGINDPTTAVHALSHLSAVLVELAGRPLVPRHLRDGEGRLRAVVPQWNHEELLQLVLEEPLHCADGQPAVLRRIAGLLREVAWATDPGPIGRELRRLMERCAEVAGATTAVAPDERRRWCEDVDDALAGRWLPDPPGSAT